jgi:beta-glucosidase
MKLKVVVCFALVLALVDLPVLARVSAPKTPQPSQSNDRRVDQLLSQMTIEEKVGQLNQLFYFTQFMKPEMIEPGIREGKIGSLLFVTDPAIINRFQKVAVENSRLKIPLLFGFDVIHGFRTVFPVPLAMASSWDPALVEQAQGIAAKEARAVGVRWTFAPMVDIARDPRWGRIVEGAGEDPFLGARIAAAQVESVKVSSTRLYVAFLRRSSSFVSSRILMLMNHRSRRSTTIPSTDDWRDWRRSVRWCCSATKATSSRLSKTIRKFRLLQSLDH